MKLRLFLLAFSFFLLSGFLPANFVQTAFAYDLTADDCGYPLRGAGQTYRLVEDMTCEDNGLIVEADNVVIDGNNHVLRGNKALKRSGISTVVSTITGLTIKDFASIENFDRGINLVSKVDNSLIQNNVIRFNNQALMINDSWVTTANSFFGNTISNNSVEIGQDSPRAVSENIFQNNNFISNRDARSRMIRSFTGDRTAEVGTEMSFGFDMYGGNNATCSSCTYSLTLYPQGDTVSSSKTDNQVTGSFTPSRTGTYSLKVTVTDSSGNITSRNFLFLVSAVSGLSEKTTSYFFRSLDPTHGQPNDADTELVDAGSLLFTIPDGDEYRSCGDWVQVSPDVLPEYPFSILSSSYSEGIYNTNDQMGPSFGIQRSSTYDAEMDFSQGLESTTFMDSPFYVTLSDLNWALDYPDAWYWLALKIESSGGGQPFWKSLDYLVSIVNFTYQYANTPAIKSVSNTNINVLSVTASSTNANLARIELDNPDTAAASTIITLDGFARPFLNSTSTIDSSGTLVETLVNANATTSINSVPLDLTFDTGSIEVVINTWNTGGDYRKTWTENGTDVETAEHTIGDLEPGANYGIFVDQVGIDAETANANGQITFTYSGGYSSHTFDVRLNDATEPTVSLDLPLASATVSGSAVALEATASDDTELAGVQFKLDDNILIRAEDVVSPYAVTWDSAAVTDGSHTLIAVARDIFGNYATSSPVSVNVSNSVSELEPQTSVITPRSSSGSRNTKAKVTPSAPVIPLLTIPTPLTSNIPIIFTQPLYFGLTNSNVKLLQLFLNNHGFTIATTGAGAPGHETNYFGNLTKQALGQFQLKNGLVKSLQDPAFGYLGPKTRALINSQLSL